MQYDPDLADEFAATRYDAKREGWIEALEWAFNAWPSSEIAEKLEELRNEGSDQA